MIGVELKALDHLTGKDTAQLLNYLKATGTRLGCSSIWVAPKNWNENGGSSSVSANSC
jgi:hypothetical protein